MNKEKFIDSKGAPITQGLFLETSYHNTDNVVYTLKSRDYEYKGKKLISLKKAYLDFEDITEYEFANEYLLDWDHWNRIKRNKMIAPYLEGWKEELELKIRAQAIRSILDSTADEKSFQANKWLADRGWEKRGPGRPSKQEIVKEEAMQERIADEFSEDLKRMKM